jgi:hypothetical protein
MRQRPRWRHLLNELALVGAYILWIVRHSLICRIYNSTAVTVESLWAE